MGKYVKWVQEVITEKREVLKNHLITMGVPDVTASLISLRTSVDYLTNLPSGRFVSNLWLDAAFIWSKAPDNGGGEKAYWFWADIRKDLIEQGF